MTHLKSVTTALQGVEIDVVVGYSMIQTVKGMHDDTSLKGNKN